MARPCKIIESQSRHNTKEEIEERKSVEENLKGSNDKIEKPPKYLNESQKEIYKYIITELSDTGILRNLDVYILTTCTIAVDRLMNIEKIINKNPGAILNKDLMSAKDKYTKDLYRCCNELSLSPQSRAKLGSLALANKEKREDPLLQILSDDDED
ncbi:phage terminase small subunit P27 family [Clostridium cochlearium]|uniref:phage terminase small subunit P27 family n=1 Tax=Clostridium cochlearium TaxID=1494 RepID=UPI000BBBDD26|nr:phage terminase small subunit P27 family [Clostridium cochlearium]